MLQPNDQFYIDKVLAAHSGFTESSRDLETKITSWRNEIDVRQKKLDDQSKNLEIERSLLTEEIAEEREDDIAFEQEKLNQYIEQRFGVGGDWIQQKLKLAQPAQDEILTAIREIASDRKLNYVFDSSADILVLHSEKKYDISELVIKYLKIYDKKKAQAFLTETKKQERKQRSNPSIDEKRKEIQQQNSERRQLAEERKADRKRQKEAKKPGNKTQTNAAAPIQSKDEIREARKAEYKRKKQEREQEIARKKKEKEEALAKRKKERLEELERRKKEFEEKRKQTQQKSNN